MSKSVKRIICTALALVLCFSFVGCGTINDVAQQSGTQETQASKNTDAAAGDSAAPVSEEKESLSTESGSYVGNADETYYMVAFLSGHPFWVGCYEGAKAAAKQLGVTVKFGGDPEYDVNKAVAVFEQVVATKPAGVLLTCITPEPFVEPINNAIEAGVPVITYDSDSPNSNRLSFCSTDNTYLGSYLCKYFAEELMDNGKGVVGITGRPDQLNIRQRMDGFQTEAQNYPDMVIANVVDNKGDVTKATAAVTAMIQSNPDITVIFAADGIGAAGAAQAIRDLDRLDIKIMTVDSTQDILDQIKSGEIYGTVAQNTFNMGYWAMMEAYANHHKLVDPFSDWQEKGSSPLPPFINTGVDIVTSDNVDSFVVNPTDPM